MHLVNKRELAELVGKSERTLTEWQKNGMPIFVDAIRGGENKYDMPEVIEWLIERAVNKALGGVNNNPDGLDSDMELARLRHHQANIAQLDEHERRGVLLNAEDVNLAMGELDNQVRSAVLAMPARLAPSLVKIRTVKEMRNKIHQACLTVLSSLSEHGDSDEDAEELERDELDHTTVTS